MDDDFIHKAYRSVLLTWALAMAWTLALQKPWIALSITLGTAVGTAVLASFEYMVRKAFVPGAAKPGRALVKLALLKYPLLGAILYLTLRWNKINPLAFCGGIVLVHFAILAKLAGIRLVERREKKDLPAMLSGPIADDKES